MFAPGAWVVSKDMYAVIRTGGKQYRVAAGQVVKVERLDGEVGATVAFDQVLMVGDDGVIRGPAGDGRVASVSHDDIADVATAVLLDERPRRHDGATYDLTGPEALTLAEVASTLSRVTGREIAYHPETVDEAYASRAGYDAPRFEVDGWVSSYSAIAAGALARVSDTVRRFTERPAQSFAQWLDDYPEEWEHLRR